MKNDTISRRAAIDAFYGAKVDEKGWCTEYEIGYNDGIDFAVSQLSALPSAQPEQKKGKWIPHIEESREYIGTAVVGIIYDYWFCDTCGYRVEDGRPLYNFCPNCGNAKEMKYGSN